MVTTEPSDIAQQDAEQRGAPGGGVELVLSESVALTPTHLPLMEQRESVWNVSVRGALFVSREFFPHEQLAPTSRRTTEVLLGATLELIAAPFEVDFGPIPVSASYHAKSYLAQLPSRAVKTVYGVLRNWTSDPNHRVVSVDVSLFADPEDHDWLEVVFTLFTAFSSTDCMRLWDDLGKEIGQEVAVLDAASREAVNTNLAFQVVSSTERE